MRKETVAILEELTSEYDFAAFSILLICLICSFAFDLLPSEKGVQSTPFCATSRCQIRQVASVKKIIIENRISLRYFL